MLLTGFYSEGTLLRLLKSADDTVTVRMLNNDETSHVLVVDTFLKWCSESFIECYQNNDICIDFRCEVALSFSIVIND